MAYSIIISFLCITACMPAFNATRNEFIKQPQRIVHQPSRQKLREDLVRIFDEYAHTLLSEIDVMATLLCKGEDISSDVTKLLVQRSKALDLVIVFFEQGVMPPSQNSREVSAIPSEQEIVVIGNLISLIVRAEQHILKVIRDMLEESADCCFVTTRSKPLLQEYHTTVRCFQQASIDHMKKLQKHYTKPITLTQLNTKEHEHGVV
jgi:hypothetical protein